MLHGLRCGFHRTSQGSGRVVDIDVGLCVGKKERALFRPVGVPPKDPPKAEGVIATESLETLNREANVHEATQSRNANTGNRETALRDAGWIVSVSVLGTFFTHIFQSQARHRAAVAQPWPTR